MNTEGWCNKIRLRIAQLRAQLKLKDSWFSVVKVSSGPQTSDPKTPPAFYLTPSPMTDLGAIEGGTMRSAFLHCKAAVFVTCVVGYFLSKPGGAFQLVLLDFDVDFVVRQTAPTLHGFKKIVAFPLGRVLTRDVEDVAVRVLETAHRYHHRASGLIDHRTRTPCRCPCGSKYRCEYTLCLCPLYKINPLEIRTETSRNAESHPS